MLRARRLPFFAALALALLAPGLARAARPVAWADSAGAVSPAADAHRPGRWSLDFAIQDNFTLASFKGTSVSATRNTSPHGAWRFGLGYGVSTNVGTSALTQFTDTTTTGLGASDSHHEAVNLSGVVMRLHRFRPGRRVAAYVGLGPSASWNRVHDEQIGSTGLPDTRVVDNFYSHDVNLGVAADLGVEGFATRDVSLFAQYGSVGGYRFSKVTHRQVTIDRTTGRPAGPLLERTDHSHGWQITANAVRFGVSLYL